MRVVDHMALFIELMEFKMKTGENINIFATHLKKIFLNIQNIDKGFSENGLTYQYFCYLPSCYDNSVQHLLRTDYDSFKFDLIVNEIVTEEARLKLRDADNCQKMNALSIQMSVPKSKVAFSSRKKSFPNKTKRRRCWNSGRFGHVSAHCSQRKVFDTQH